MTGSPPYYLTIQSQGLPPGGQVETLIGIGSAEDCTTDVDEDLDGSAGCLDADCFRGPECPAVCPEPTPTPIEVSGDYIARDWSNRYGFRSEMGCFRETVAERVFVVEALAGQTIAVDSLADNPPVGLVNVMDASLACFPSAEGEAVCLEPAQTYPDPYRAIAPHDGLYAVHIAANPRDIRAYNWTISVQDPESP